MQINTAYNCAPEPVAFRMSEDPRWIREYQTSVSSSNSESPFYFCSRAFSRVSNLLAAEQEGHIGP